jgi:hypothetical protein
MFMQCNGGGDEMSRINAGQEISANETPETPQTLEEVYQQMDASYDKVYEKAACPSLVKIGQVDGIVGKWKLVLEINGKDTIDRSCENLVYHFKKDGTLAISGSAEKKEEDVTYEYRGYPFCPVCLPFDPQPNLSIGDNTAFFCQVLLIKMILYPQWKPQGETSKQPVFEIQKLFSRIK